MVSTIISHKATRLFLILGGFFVANALIAEIIGVKIFSLEKTLGFPPLGIKLFGESFNMDLTAGVLLWPVVFIMTDIINEYYGIRGVRFLSWLTAGLIAFAFIVFQGAMWLAPANFWSATVIGCGACESNPIPEGNMQAAYSAILGQGSFIIIGSLFAFVLGQIVDVFIFHRIKKVTGERSIWLRATGSTLVSQLIDSFVVLFIAFYVGPRVSSTGGVPWEFAYFISVGTVNYIYKFVVAILMTPVIYLVHALIESYLGAELATQMKKAAMADE
jgi:uncharacterized integral membrane protein (TIGR00697 family)